MKLSIAVLALITVSAVKINQIPYKNELISVTNQTRGGNQTLAN